MKKMYLFIMIGILVISIVGSIILFDNLNIKKEIVKHYEIVDEACNTCINITNMHTNEIESVCTLKRCFHEN